MSKKAAYYRSIFISDIHLGFHGCKAEELTQWLKQHKCDYLFLLGDIVDLWALQSRFYWPTTHTQLVRSLLKMSKATKRTVYTPGNHDWLIKNKGTELGNILVCDEYIHTAADGKRYLCLHGDKYDGVLARNKYLVAIGCWLYDLLLSMSTRLSTLRRYAGRVHWSLSKYLKHKVKSAVSYIADYEKAVVQSATDHGADGVICGHIHHATITDFNETVYVNCGDWVESLTVVVEHFDGSLEVLHPYN